MAVMIEVGIVGGSGYGAIELIRLLQHHPAVHIKYVFSHSKQNEPMISVCKIQRYTVNIMENIH